MDTASTDHERVAGRLATVLRRWHRGDQYGMLSWQPAPWPSDTHRPRSRACEMQSRPVRSFETGWWSSESLITSGERHRASVFLASCFLILKTINAPPYVPVRDFAPMSGHRRSKISPELQHDSNDKSGQLTPV